MTVICNDNLINRFKTFFKFKQVKIKLEDEKMCSFVDVHFTSHAFLCANRYN